MHNYNITIIMLRNFVTFRLWQGFMQTFHNYLIMQTKVKAVTSGSPAEFKDHQVADSGLSEGMS